MKAKGQIDVDYFNLNCGECSNPSNFIVLSNARWVSGVPQVVMTCSKCGATQDVKVHPPTLMNVVPPR